MNITAFIAAVAGDQTTNVVIALLLLFAFVDWITGSLRAISDSTFKAEAFDVFLRTTMSKVVNLVLRPRPSDR